MLEWEQQLSGAVVMGEQLSDTGSQGGIYQQTGHLTFFPSGTATSLNGTSQFSGTAPTLPGECTLGTIVIYITE
jgi:hypothetical protein